MIANSIPAKTTVNSAVLLPEGKAHLRAYYGGAATLLCEASGTENFYFYTSKTNKKCLWFHNIFPEKRSFYKLK